jgi:hypothetical protein
MPLEFDIVDDMEIFDYQISGFYKVRETDNTFTEYPHILCLRRAISHRTSPAAGASLQQDSAVFHVKFTDLEAAGVLPKFRDRILDEQGVEWWVRSYSTETLSTRYRMECTRCKTTPETTGPD